MRLRARKVDPFDGLTDKDRARLDRALATVPVTPGLEGLRPQPAHTAPVDATPPSKRGRRA